MKRNILLAYQLLIGASDTLTGALLMVAPAFTVRMMGLHPPVEALPFLAFIGAFVLAVGLACLLGANLTRRGGCKSRVATVWQLTAISRASVAIFITTQVLAQTLEAGWMTVAFFDAACVVIQAVGLRRGWLTDGAR